MSVDQLLQHIQRMLVLTFLLKSRMPLGLI